MGVHWVFSLWFGRGGMSVLGVEVVEDGRLDAQSLLHLCVITSDALRPAHLWHTNTLTLGISLYALDTLKTAYASTLAPSSTFRGHTIDARNFCLVAGAG